MTTRRESMSGLSTEARSPIPEARPVAETALPLPLYRRGKVRDVYEAGRNLLIVATDRISAFDHVLPTPVPDKGRVLTALSPSWFPVPPTTSPTNPTPLIQATFRPRPQGWIQPRCPRW